MRFIHLSDTHLGYQHLGLEERKRDFFDAFDYVVDFAIEKNVDFIIHTGDFFHSSRPSNETILDGISILRKLKEKNIPIYTISGNHDRGSGTRDKSPLEILKEFGLKVVDNWFDTVEDINIFGLRHIHTVHLRKIDINQILEELYYQASRKDFNILMLHFEFQPFFLNGLSLENSVPEGYFQYIGIGHYHQAQKPMKIKDSLVVYPGSTDYTQFNERDYSKKGFYLVEKDNDRDLVCEFIEIPVRKFIVKRFDDHTIDTVLEDIKGLDFSDQKKPVLVLKGKTDKNLTKKDMMQFIEDHDLKDRFLHIDIDIEKNLLDYEFTYLGSDTEKNRSEIEKIVSENIDDQELKSKIFHIISVLNGFENIQELENYIKENRELFKI